MSLEFAILTALSMCGDYLEPEPALHAGVNRLLGRRPTLTELRAACGKLEASQQILALDHPDNGRRYKITDNGRARLLE